MRFKKYLQDDIKIPIKVGDVILGGKFKNKRITVKEIGKNDKGDITINGKPLLKFRIIPQDELKESSFLGVISAPGPSIRRGPKTGYSFDNIATREKGTTPANKSGFANTNDHYYDPLDPRNKKIKRKKSWITGNSRLMIAGW